MCIFDVLGRIFLIPKLRILAFQIHLLTIGSCLAFLKSGKALREAGL